MKWLIVGVFVNGEGDEVEEHIQYVDSTETDPVKVEQEWNEHTLKHDPKSYCWISKNYYKTYAVKA